jgi:hypothetical protein
MNIAKKVRDTVDNARDSMKETMHRSTADAEQARREATGGTMTPGDEIASVANEVKNRVEAVGHKVRRELRKHS